MRLDELRRRRFAAIQHVASAANKPGKTKLQKLLYFSQEACGVPLAYRFEMYHYGPYSFDLDDDLLRMRTSGLIQMDLDPSGYGFRISPVRPATQDEVAQPQPEDRQALDAVVREFGRLKAQQLELRATLHFVGQILGPAPRAEVEKRVRALKPKFRPETVARAYDELSSRGWLAAVS